MARWRPLRAAIWRRGRACFSAGSRSTRAAASAPFHSWTRCRHFRLHPPHSRANLQSRGYQATLAQRRDWRTRKAAGGTDGADWCHERGRVERGVTQMSDWRSKWEGEEAEMLHPAEERIWSGVWVQKRDSGLVRRGSRGGDTNAKKWQGQDGQSWKRESQTAGCYF